MKRMYPNKKLPTFDDIASLGWTFNLKFKMPPFDGNENECYFDIHEFKKTPSFQEFIKLIERFEIPYEYGKKKGSDRIYLIINRGDIDGF